MTDSRSVCAELCCAGCCVAILGCIQQWCFMAPCGLRRSGRSTAGCCDNSFGGFDKEEDDITRAEREDREKESAKEAKLQEKGSHSQPMPHPVMVLTPPTPVLVE